MAKILTRTVVIGEIVRKRRKDMKLTAQDMAKILGIHIRTYQRWEAGAWTVDELESICNTLNLKLIILPKELIE